MHVCTFILYGERERERESEREQIEYMNAINIHVCAHSYA